MPRESLYRRWIAFGLFSSHSRLHGSSTYRVPWHYSAEACDTLRFFTRLKCRLMPYVFGKAVEAHRYGIPVMRPMLLEFPDDPASDTLDKQYMLGHALLVAPVFTEEGATAVYLPDGRWTSLITGEVVEGGRWRKELHGFQSLPLYVRPNTLLPVGALETQPDYGYARNCVIRLYQLNNEAEASAVVTSAKGDTTLELKARRSGSRIHLEWTGQAIDWKLQLMGVQPLAGHEDCDV